MRIANIELSNKKLMIIISALAAAVILILLMVYVPLAGRLMAKKAECRLLEAEAKETRSSVEAAGKAQGNRVLMSEKGVGQAIEELTKYGKTKGISFNFIRSREITEDKASGIRILPIEMQITAKDEQISDFMGSLDELKKGLIKVHSFDIVPDKDDRSRLHANLVVDLYLSEGDYAE